MDFAAPPVKPPRWPNGWRRTAYGYPDAAGVAGAVRLAGVNTAGTLRPIGWCGCLAWCVLNVACRAVASLATRC